METISRVLGLLSLGVYLWAVVGLINPAWAKLPNRWASVKVWLVAVLLLFVGYGLHEDGDTTPASSVSSVPQDSAVAEPVEIDCSDWYTRAFFVAAEVSDVVSCLQGGADVEARDADGRTPLRWAAAGGSAEVVAVMLEAGSDPQARDLNSNTLLHSAATFNDNPAVIEVLLDAGADPDVRNENGDTPLHGAARLNENPAVIEALLDAGADPNVRNEDGDTPLHEAAIFNKNPAVIEVLLNVGADPNARKKGGETPLHHSVLFNGNLSVTEALLNAGADPNVRHWGGVTPLHYAAGSNENPAAIEALLNVGADPNVRIVYPAAVEPLFRESPALEAVAYRGMLFTAPADPDLPDWTGDTDTPLHWAARSNKNPAVIEALLNAGADPNARDRNGKTPWDLAKDREALKGSDAYWKLNQARFQSSGSRTSSDIGTGTGGGIGGGVFRVGGSVSAPQVVFKVDAEYSGQAREAKHEGTVVLNVVVQRDGTVRNVRVVQSLGFGLDEKAIEAVQKWRFRPGMKSGEPVDVAAIIEVTFRLL